MGLPPVLSADSLRGLERFPRAGIEGWLKVEACAALGSLVVKLQNRGLDLVLADGSSIELKAATDLNPSYIADGAKRYGVPCLFLGDGRDVENCLARLDRLGVDVIAQHVYSAGEAPWILGLARARAAEQRSENMP